MLVLPGKSVSALLAEFTLTLASPLQEFTAFLRSPLAEFTASAT